MISAEASGKLPLSLDPQNPHYFLFRGKPAVLITSGEHYGAVVNLDFDEAKYLKALAADGLNLTRTFSGAYVEPQGAFGIASNTLAPGPGRLICPWARSNQPGYAGGGNKFDLTRWDDAYFRRLKGFVNLAGKHGIVVELNLFCPMYDDSQWKVSPMNAANNVNGIGAVDKHEVYTLSHNDGLLAVEDAMVRKIVSELRDEDNLYYEICNEPYFGGVTMDWQHHIADVISNAEKGFRHHHLISQNVANGSQRIDSPYPTVSIFNFHYTHPPTTVAENYELNRVIGENETGFRGTADEPYRTEAWEFILAGGALYNNLDYSFTVGHEDGTFQYPASQPGGGNPTFRKQIGVLKRFIESFDFVKMRPAAGLVIGLSRGAQAQALAEPGRQYAVYASGAGGQTARLNAPAGAYDIRRLDPVTGQETPIAVVHHAGGSLSLAIPDGMNEVAFSVKGS
jgi:hypothetical protein